MNPGPAPHGAARCGPRRSGGRCVRRRAGRTGLAVPFIGGPEMLRSVLDAMPERLLCGMPRNAALTERREPSRPRQRSHRPAAMKTKIGPGRRTAASRQVGGGTAGEAERRIFMIGKRSG